MNIITYSDLHLEFGKDIVPAPEATADVMVLCGDIVVMTDLVPLDRFLQHWRKPVLYVLGNHEYYGRQPMREDEARLIDHLAQHHPNVKVLRSEAVTIDGVHFFGGTMWTDFDGADEAAMLRAELGMNDFRRIMVTPGNSLTPADTIAMHGEFVAALEAWFTTALDGPRVVVTHHAPTLNPKTQHKPGGLQAAFNSLDMEALIWKYQPALWLYGHTHECDDHILGNTRIVSNQTGYPKGDGFECVGFDSTGVVLEISED